MWQRLLTISTWALVGASAVAYTLRLWPGSAPSQAALAASTPVEGELSGASLKRLMGGATVTETALPTDNRYSLLGVAAPRADDQQGLQGVALLSVDGAPPRAVRVGQWVDAQTQLLRVSARGAELGRDGVARVRLPLSGVPEAATGQLPAPVPLVGSASPAVPQAMPNMQHLPSTPLPGVAMPPMPSMPGPSTDAPPARDADEAGPRRAPMRPETVR
jgi:general secretion pathway protein C